MSGVSGGALPLRPLEKSRGQRPCAGGSDNSSGM